MPLVRFVVEDDGEITIIDVPLATDRRDVMVREAVATVAHMLMDAAQGHAYPAKLSVKVHLPHDQSIIASASVTLSIRWPDTDGLAQAKSGQQGD